MATPTFTATGAKATSAATLPKDVFSIEVKSHELLKDAYLAYRANTRPNLAKTLKRGEVSGGGKKPWAQKGTGRARVGSSRSPIWRKGGIIFGPTGNENYTRKINVKAKRLAIAQALTLACEAKKVIVIESFKTTGKVKETAQLMNKIGANRQVLLVVPEVTDLVKRATNNLPDVFAVQATRLNVCDILDSGVIVIAKDSLTAIEKWLGGTK
jgi:large subunit ribosomal protein L4